MNFTLERSLKSIIQYKHEPITEFPDDLKSEKKELFKEIEKGIKNGTWVIITGSGFSIEAEIPCDCNCEYCERTDTETKFFEKKEDAIKYIKKYNKEYDLYDLEENDIFEDVYFIKAIKQETENLGDLFNSSEVIK